MDGQQTDGQLDGIHYAFTAYNWPRNKNVSLHVVAHSFTEQEIANTDSNW